MTWPIVVIALILAGGIGYRFHRSWRLEHRKTPPGEEEGGKETHVYVPPSSIIWILLIWLIIFALQFGLPEGLIRFASLLGQGLLVLSVYYLFLLVSMPFFRKHFSARVCATLWLVPAFLMPSLHLFLPAIPFPRLSILVPRSTLSLLFMIWGIGFVLVGGAYLLSDLLFSRWVRRMARPEADEEILALYEKERTELEYQDAVPLLRADVPAPFSMGWIPQRRRLVLPDRAYTPEELSMIFRHELHHLQRCDLDTKVFLCLCRAFGWFNPLVWIATKKAAEDLELSCDEIVTENMDAPSRRAYAALLLDNAAPSQGCTTCLSAAASTLRYRLKGVVERRRRAKGTWLLMACVFGCTLIVGIISINDARGSYASLLKERGNIQFVSDSKYSLGQKWDIPALQAIINNLELEHVASARRDMWTNGRSISFILPDGRADLTEEALVINHYSVPSFFVDCYLLKSPLDWAALEACLIQE